MTSSSNGHLFHNLMLFGRLLRSAGMDVHAGRMMEVAQALEYVGISRRRDFRHTLRTLLVHRQRDLAVFDEAFQVFWRQPKDPSSTMDLRSLGEQRRYRQPQVGPPTPGSDSGSSDGQPASLGDEDRVEITQTYSSREVLRAKDFSEYTIEEALHAREMMGELDWDLGVRRTRRWMAGQGQALELRRVLRRNMKYGGELLDLPRRSRKHKLRPLVLICDVSGSMERYTRMLLHFIHTIAGSLDRVEAFLFATRLTRISGHLKLRGVDSAVEEVARAVPDWAGGTRIGETLKEFNFRWARRVLGWGAVVLIISDGWDRGEPDLLSREMARLQRSCHRLIWLNPLLGSPDYQPLTRGMQAAIPYIDDFVPVHNLDSLEALAEHLSALSPQRPSRPQQASFPTAAAPIPTGTTPPSTSPHSEADPSFRHPLWGKDNLLPP